MACCTRVSAGDGDCEVGSDSAVAEMVALSSPSLPLPASTTWRASSDRRGRSWELTSRVGGGWRLWWGPVNVWLAVIWVWVLLWMQQQAWQRRIV